VKQKVVMRTFSIEYNFSATVFVAPFQNAVENNRLHIFYLILSHVIVNAFI